MLNGNLINIYNLWFKKSKADPDLAFELKEMEGNMPAIEDAFYKELEFGTGGLRGVIGAGTNRMNVYLKKVNDQLKETRDTA